MSEARSIDSCTKVLNEIPSRWRQIEFGNQLDIRSGKGFSLNEYSDHGLKLLRIDNVSWGKITWDSIAFLPLSYTEEHPKLVLNEGDILLALNRPITQGKLKIARLTNSDLPAILYQRVGKILLKNKSLSNDFVYHWLSYWLFDFLNQSLVGSDQPFINISEIKKVQMLLPSAEEQQKIAAILTSVDNIIEKTEAQINKLQDLKKGMMQELLSPQEGSRQSKGIGHTEFKDSPVGMIPKEWEVKTLKEIAKISSGSTPSRSNADYFSESYSAIPWVKTMDLNDALVDVTGERITDEAVKETSCKLIPRGSVLLAMYGGWNQIGRTGVLAMDASTNQAISALTPIDEVDGEFINYWLVSNRYKWKSVAASSRKDPNITKQDVEGFQIVVPNIEEQKEIVKKLNGISNHIRLKLNSLMRYRDLKKALMQDLLTGKVRVKINEPQREAVVD